MWALIVVLAHSRHSFVWPTYSQKLEEVIAGLEAVWDFFGGIPKYLVIDNFPAAVAGADSLHPRLTRGFLEYSQHRGFITDPARVRHPRDKPKVERGVQYVRERFFKGGDFKDLTHLRSEAARWCRDVAGLRIHGTTRRQPLQVFLDEERQALNPWDGEPYEVTHWRSAKVHPDHHVAGQYALYSVPSTLCSPGQQVEIGLGLKLVRIYHRGRLIKVHSRQPRGGRSTDTQDYPAELSAYTLRAPDGIKRSAAEQGPAVAEFAERLFDGLRNPDQSAEDLLATLTLRRADGREISLRDFPLAQALSTGETIRAEEIVLQVPDGRRITTIINATPIPTEDGGVESVIVTMQDMTSLEELERLRAEFLGMVSHELRAPLTSIRGSADTLMDAQDSLDPAEMRQFHRIIREQADQMQGLITDLLDVARIGAGTLAVAPESSDVAVLVDRARNTFLSGGGRRDIRLDLPPDLPRVMADRRRIVQVLGNLLSNAARHSPAGYPIRVAAVDTGVQVEISVSDDGAGIAAERLPHLFHRFSRPGANDPGSGTVGTGLGRPSARG